MEKPDSAALEAKPRPNERRRVLITLALGAVGFVINGYPLFLLPDASIVFGGVFYLLIANMRGPAHGFAAAAIAGSRTMWTHHGSTIVFPLYALEGLFVGFFRRRFRSLFWADLTFWICVGIPLLGVGLAYSGGHPYSLVGILAAKNLVNGLINVLLVEFLLTVPLVKLWLADAEAADTRSSLRPTLQKAFVLVAAAPVFVVSILGGRLYLENERAEALRDLEVSANTVALTVDAHLDHHRSGLQALGESLGEDLADGTKLNHLLGIHHRSFPSFLTMLVADTEGTIVAASPNVSASGDPVVGSGSSVRHREYFRAAIANESTYISDVFRGRGFGNDVIVAISAPIRTSDGRTLGIVEGSLDLDVFRKLVESFRRGKVVVVDRSNNVVLATPSTGYRSLQPFDDSSQLEAGQLTESTAFLLDQLRRDPDASLPFAAAAAAVESAGWQAFALEDAADVIGGLQKLYLGDLGVALAGIIIAILIARRMSVFVTLPIENLHSRVHSLRDDGSVDDVRHPPANSPREVSELDAELDRMVERLREGRRRLELTLRERDQMNVLLEETAKGLDGRVKQRTAELDRARRDAEESRERYAALVDGIDAIVWEADPATWNFTFVNRKAEEILGYPRERWLMEESFLQTILHPDDQDETIALCVGATARGEDQELEYRAVAADGRTVWMRDRVRVIKDETGRPVLLRGIMVDITASKNAEGENKALEAQLRQAQKMEAVGQLAGGIAHDFNNLLTVINGYAEILKLKLANTDALGRYADDIFSAGERAARLTHQLLAFSRKQVLTPTVLDLNELLTGTQSLLKRLIGETIEIDLHLDDRPCPARVDEGQIQQVVMNLAVNARDAMPHGGTIVLSTRNTTAEEVAEDWPNMKPGRYVRISLEDNGVGMAPNIVEQVFEPFFTTKPRGEGTGLGLSTAYGIIKQSGGYIWADSHPGRGTRFDVFLPCSSQPIEPATSAPPQADSAARRTVLLVEDDDLVRELASEVLEDDGFEVHGATNGREALDLADRLENFDVLITDLVMPHVDGVALSKRIRKTRPRLPVVVMSGYPDRARVVDSVGLGECVFLNKPFTRDKLLSTLRDLFSALDTPKQVH